MSIIIESRAGLTDALRSVPLFACVDAATLSALSARCRRRTFPPRTALFHEGDPGHTLYLVLSGHVNVQAVNEADGAPVHIARRGPGEHFGELSLLDGGRRSTDAVVGSEPAELLLLDRDAFLEVMREHPGLAQNIIAALTARLREATRATLEHQTCDVTGRLARLLLDAAAEQGSTDGGVRLTATQAEIATRIGARRETVSRALARLKASGAARPDGKGAWKLDRAKLERLF
jgi:CRP-like cAMP-binding protein